MGWISLGIGAIFVLAYLPLAINELTTGFAELRGATTYLAGDRAAAEVAIPVRFGIAGLRVISWPLTGLIVDGFVAGALATVAVIAIVVWRWRSPDEDERFVVRWFGLGLLWSTAFLTVAAPSLAVVVRGLPNDHYHAFADPLVFVLVGVGAAALVREIRAPAGAALVTAVVVALLAWNVTHLPPAVHPDGGFPAGETAGDRVDATLALAGLGFDRPARLVSLPDFKSTEALAYPLARLGRAFMATLPNGSQAPGATSDVTPPLGLVVMCDQLFREAIGADCGGPAENATAPDAGGPVNGPLLDRFEAAPGRWMSVYGPPS
jgi:hypothetical protein